MQQLKEAPPSGMSKDDENMAVVSFPFTLGIH